MGKVNMQNLRTPSTEEAREMQLKSAQKLSQNRKEKRLIRQVIEERLGGEDLDEIVDTYNYLKDSFSKVSSDNSKKENNSEQIEYKSWLED